MHSTSNCVKGKSSFSLHHLPRLTFNARFESRAFSEKMQRFFVDWIQSASSLPRSTGKIHITNLFSDPVFSFACAGDQGIISLNQAPDIELVSSDIGINSRKTLLQGTSRPTGTILHGTLAVTISEPPWTVVPGRFLVNTEQRSQVFPQTHVQSSSLALPNHVQSS